jgi:hypothetical protein
MKKVKLFEQFINEVKFKDVESFKAYAQKHKMRPNTVVTVGGKDIKAGDVGKENGEEQEEEKDGKEVPTVEFTCYHTSRTEITKLAARPMWFTKKKKYAMAYHANAIDEGDEAFTYEIKIKGRILGLDDAARYAEEAGIDHEETVADLTAQPDVADIKKLIVPYSKICDGFDHWDYDPIDWGDAESTIIFNPTKVATLVKQIK